MARCTEVITAKGLKAVNEPYEFPVGRQADWRAAISAEINARLAVHQSSLVCCAKGYVVSFTFIGGSDDEMTKWIEGLQFGKG